MDADQSSFDAAAYPSPAVAAPAERSIQNLRRYSPTLIVTRPTGWFGIPSG